MDFCLYCNHTCLINFMNSFSFSSVFVRSTFKHFLDPFGMLLLFFAFLYQPFALLLIHLTLCLLARHSIIHSSCSAQNYYGGALIKFICTTTRSELNSKYLFSVLFNLFPLTIKYLYNSRCLKITHELSSQHNCSV